MTIYATLSSGVVTALVSPPDGVLLSALSFLTEAQITSAVAVPAGTPIQVGWTYANGSFSSPFAAPAPTLAQQAAAAATAGLTITLSGSITLAATLFPTDATTQRKLSNVAAVIGATGGFPGGVTTLPIKDASGAWHVLDLAQWKAVAGVIASYVAGLDLIADGNPLGATDLPSSSVALTV